VVTSVQIYVVHIAGWQWEPVDRPTFREIHVALDNMIHTSSTGEGSLELLNWICQVSRIVFIVLVLQMVIMHNFVMSAGSDGQCNVILTSLYICIHVSVYPLFYSVVCEWRLTNNIHSFW